MSKFRYAISVGHVKTLSASQPLHIPLLSGENTFQLNQKTTAVNLVCFYFEKINLIQTCFLNFIVLRAEPPPPLKPFGV